MFLGGACIQSWKWAGGFMQRYNYRGGYCRTIDVYKGKLRLGINGECLIEGGVAQTELRSRAVAVEIDQETVMHPLVCLCTAFMFL